MTLRIREVDGIIEIQGQCTNPAVIPWPHGMLVPSPSVRMDLYMPRFDNDGNVISAEGTQCMEWLTRDDGKVELHLTLERGIAS